MLAIAAMPIQDRIWGVLNSGQISNAAMRAYAAWNARQVLDRMIDPRSTDAVTIAETSLVNADVLYASRDLAWAVVEITENQTDATIAKIAALCVDVSPYKAAVSTSLFLILVLEKDTTEAAQVAKLIELLKAEDPSPAVVPSAFDVARTKVAASIAFGQSLMVEFAAFNVLAGRTTEQVKQLLLVSASLRAAIAAGALPVALDSLAAIPFPVLDANDSNIVLLDGTRVTYFRNKIQAYLGIALT